MTNIKEKMTTKNKTTVIALALTAAVMVPTLVASGAFAYTTSELTAFFDANFPEETKDLNVESKIRVAENILNGEIDEYPYKEERQAAMDKALSLILQIDTASSQEQKAKLQDLYQAHKEEMLKYGLIAREDLEGPDREEWLERMNESNLVIQEGLAKRDSEHTHTGANFIASLIPKAFATGSHTDDWYVISKIKYWENGFVATFDTKSVWTNEGTTNDFWVSHNIELPSYLWSDQMDMTHQIDNFDHSANPKVPDTFSYGSVYDDQTLQLRNDPSCYDDRYWTIFHNNYKVWTYCSLNGDGIDENDLVYTSLNVADI